MRKAALALSFSLCAALWASAASARDPAAAEVLYRSARDAAKKGDWATACAQFAESQRLDPAPGTLLNLADCEEHRGLVAAAWIHYVEAEPQFKPGDSRATLAHDRAAALDKKVPRIRIELEPGAPADAKVFRDDVELGAASLGVPLPVEPGAHVVVVKVGSVEKRFPVNATTGATVDVVASAPAPEPQKTEAPAAAPPPETPPVTHAPEKLEPASDTRTLGWILAGAGGVAIAAGAVTGVLALSKASSVKSACGPDYATCDAASVNDASTGKTFATVSTIAFIGGAVLGAAGIFFVVRSPGTTTAWVLGPGGVRGAF